MAFQPKSASRRFRPWKAPLCGPHNISAGRSAGASCSRSHGMKAGFLGLAFVSVLFTGCGPDTRDADLKQCIAKPSTTLEINETAEEKHDAKGGEVADCMSALGYRHDDLADAKCIDDIDFNSSCYVRRH
jgi:hypothetical protein